MRKPNLGDRTWIALGYFGILLGCFWCDFEMVFLMILGAVSDCFGVLLGFFWNDFNIGLDIIWGTFLFHLGSFPHIFGFWFWWCGLIDECYLLGALL